MNINNNNNNHSSSVIDSSVFEIMSEPLIPTQIANLVAPSILSMSDSALSTSAAKEHDAIADESSSFIDTPAKDGMSDFHNAMMHHVKEKNDAALAHSKKTMLLCIVLW